MKSKFIIEYRERDVNSTISDMILNVFFYLLLFIKVTCSNPGKGNIMNVPVFYHEVNNYVTLDTI